MDVSGVGDLGRREVPLCIPCFGDEEFHLVREVLSSGWLAHGPMNRAFEESFRSYIDVPHAICLNSCTSALFLALVANGIRGEVILPSFSFVASANAVVTAGAIPVFADVEYDTCCLDPRRVEAAIGPRTEAIMVVHYGGQAADMGAIGILAKKNHLLLIEDSAEAIGARWGGKRTGGWGTGCFSFFPTKNITTGEGGMYTTRDGEEARKVRIMAAHGIDSTTISREKDKKPWSRAACMAGYNFRLSNILAALGVAQMKHLDAMNESRRRIAGLYGEVLEKREIVLPVERAEAYHVYQMYTVKVPRERRTAMIAAMRAKGIGASVHFDPPIHRQPFYQEHGFKSDGLEITERLADSILTLPMYPQMCEADVAWVAGAIRNV